MEIIKHNPEELDKSLLRGNLDTNDVEKLLGYFLWHKNNICVSKLNNYIREFHIKISKNNVLESMYAEECVCRQSYVENTKRLSFIPFEDIKTYPFPDRNDYTFYFK